MAGIIEDVLARATLDHFTQITVHGGDAAWTFEFRPFEDGEPVEGDALQQHLLSSSPDVIDMSMTPAPLSPDAFFLLLEDDDASAASIADQQAAYDAAARVENPTLHTNGTVDCASCHAAHPARVAAARRSPLVASPDAFVSARHDLTPTPVFSNPQFIHALAWRGRDLAVNARVLHDSALSADLVEQRLKDEGHLP